MSHITTCNLIINDLDALEKACARLGLVLNRGQKHYKWYGRYVGDVKAPKDIVPDGRCEHAISLKHELGDNPHAYEVGLVKRPDGKGYSLAWDYWQRGYGLVEKISYDAGSSDANKLKDWYAAEVAAKQMRKQGFSVRASQQTRKVEVLCSK